jgi:hypothetical protein
VTLETNWPTSGTFHAVSASTELTICPDGTLRSWESATRFPSGFRFVRWSRSEG